MSHCRHDWRWSPKTQIPYVEGQTSQLCDACGAVRYVDEKDRPGKIVGYIHHGHPTLLPHSAV
jgi:hypothetical protein